MKTLLALPAAYEAFSLLVGAGRSRRIYVHDHVRALPGQKLLDIGCGPADILDYLPSIDYYGFDISPAYIESARRRYGDRGRFFCERVAEAKAFREHAGTFDIALATGVLHHLGDDEARSLFEVAARALKPGGRLVTLDGCFVEGQSRIGRYLLAHDRGRFVRVESEYVRLARGVFGAVGATVRDDLLRIPYTHIVLECRK